MDSIVDTAAYRGNSGLDERGSDPSPGPDAGLLRSLKAELREASAPIESTFLSVGESLSRTLNHMTAIGDRFHTLSVLIDNEDGVEASRRLGGVRKVTDGLAGNLGQTLRDLTELETAGTEMAALLATLSQIIGEITALAINAKVQSVQIRSTTDDFSVFNREIDRLHRLAEAATTQAVGRLTSLRGAIAAARDGADTFQRENRVRLDDVGRRLQGSLDRLAAYRNAAQLATQRFVVRVGEIGQRIARCISDLQVGDLTCQRLAHIDAALDVLALLAEPRPAPAMPAGLGWLADLDRQRRTDLSAAICSLQIRQYQEASADFGGQMASLKANLQALIQDAEAIAWEAVDLFGSSRGDPALAKDKEGKRSILHEVATDVDRALDLLHHYRRSDDLVRERVMEVSEGFAAMSRDVVAIRSIDTDMRLMGLNTTLKCARLGMAGRALGVVAQELRACSRRTEDVSRAIGEAIRSATGCAEALDRRSGSDHGAAVDLADEMKSSMDCLNRLHADQMRSLSVLTGDCAEATKVLSATVDRLAIERRLAGFVERFAERVAPHATAGEVDAPENAADLHRLFADLYTADRERKTHLEIAKGGQIIETQDRDGEIDDFFF